MDATFTLELARSCVAGKVKNTRQVLLRGAREAKSSDDEARLTRGAQDLAATLRALPGATNLDALRGLEGEAARQYFGCLPLLVRPDLRVDFSMDGRSRRPPRDRFNALISFLYSMWMNDCRSALEAAGLDPQVGYLHTLRPGRAALALDLMEELRPFADRLALTLVNRGQLTADDFDVREGSVSLQPEARKAVVVQVLLHLGARPHVSLQPEARKAVVVAFQQRKQEELQHPLLAQPIALGLVPLVQARLMARAIRGEREADGTAAGYVPFIYR
jgi:CRISPR-associated protein Cas1